MSNDPKTRNHNRYIKLNGDPIHKPLVLGIWKNPDTQVVGLGVAFATAASWYMGASNEQLISMAVDGTLAYTLYQGIDRIFQGINLKRLFNDKANVCIDRKPNPFTPPTSAKDLRSAAEMRGRSITGMIILGALTPLLYMDDFREVATAVQGPLEDVTKNGMFGAAFWLTWMTREATTAFRFHKVEKKDWTIVDTPARKKTEDSWYGKLMPGGGQ